PLVRIQYRPPFSRERGSQLARPRGAGGFAATSRFRECFEGWCYWYSSRMVFENLLFRSTRFEITGRLGTGGMGVVYAAVDRETGAKVALKTLLQLTPEGLL